MSMMYHGDAIARAVQTMEAQRQKGLAKYGVSIEQAAQSLSEDDLIQHAIEEAADLLVYLSALQIKRTKPPAPGPEGSFTFYTLDETVTHDAIKLADGDFMVANNRWRASYVAKLIEEGSWKVIK